MPNEPTETPVKKPRKITCKNCGRRFPWKKGKRFCKDSCRFEYHRFGQTPQMQMEARLKSFIKTPGFRKLLRNAIVQELGKGFHKLNTEIEQAIEELNRIA